MGSLSKGDFFAAQGRLRRQTVHVPELGGDVIVTELTGAERDAFESSTITDKKRGTQDLSNLRAKLLARALVDEGGTRMFADDDAEALGQLGSSILDPLFDVAQRLSALTRRDVEDLLGNSATAPNAAPGSG